MNVNTTANLFQTYLKYYYYHNFDGEQIKDYSDHGNESMFVYDSDGSYIKNYTLDSKGDKHLNNFIQVKINSVSLKNSNFKEIQGINNPLDCLYTYNYYSKSLNENKTLVETSDFSPYATASVGFSKDANNMHWFKNEGFWDQKFNYTLQNLEENQLNNYGIKSLLGYPLSINDIIKQVQKVYKLTMDVFVVVSLFSIFISLIIIIIATN